MGLVETYVNINAYQDYEIAAYRLERTEASEVLAALRKQIPKKPIELSVGEASSSGVCPYVQGRRLPHHSVYGAGQETVRP